MFTTNKKLNFTAPKNKQNELYDTTYTALICTALACTSLYLTALHCKNTRLNRQCFVILPQDNLPGADIVELKFLPLKQTELNSIELLCASLYGAS